MTSWRGDVELVCLPALQGSGVNATKQLAYGEMCITLGFDPRVLGSNPSRPANLNKETQCVVGDINDIEEKENLKTDV